MLRRSSLALLCIVAVMPLAACGGDDIDGDGFGCTGHTCKATFDGPGKQDLSSELGPGATVQITNVDKNSVIGLVAGQNVKLIENDPQRVGDYRVTLTEVDGEHVTLRVVRS